MNIVEINKIGHYLEINREERYYFCNNDVRKLNYFEKKALDRVIRVILSKKDIIVRFVSENKLDIDTIAFEYFIESLIYWKGRIQNG